MTINWTEPNFDPGCDNDPEYMEALELALDCGIADVKCASSEDDAYNGDFEAFERDVLREHFGDESAINYTADLDIPENEVHAILYAGANGKRLIIADGGYSGAGVRVAYRKQDPAWSDPCKEHGVPFCELCVNEAP